MSALVTDGCRSFWQAQFSSSSGPRASICAAQQGAAHLVGDGDHAVQGAHGAVVVGAVGAHDGADDVAGEAGVARCSRGSGVSPSR